MFWIEQEHFFCGAVFGQHHSHNAQNADIQIHSKTCISDNEYPFIHQSMIQHQQNINFNSMQIEI